MLKLNDLTEPQNKLVSRLYENDITFVYATMGAGKTVCTLTAISELIAACEIKKVLVVAPLKPAKEVWCKESGKWEHLNHLRVNAALGTAAKRKKAIESDCDVVVINMENLAWFCDTYNNKHDFDAVVIDEISKFKANGAKIVKKFRYQVGSFKWRVGLTGSPVHEGFTGLFSQILCLDGGERFGKNKQSFLNKYFYPTDWEQRNWELKQGAEKSLLNRIGDIVYNVEDYTDELPPITEKSYLFNTGDLFMEIYNKFKRDNVYTCASGFIITADNAAVLSGKLEQFASGFLYGGYNEGDTEQISHARLHALDDYLKLRENENENVLIFYNFEEDKLRLIEHFGNKAVVLTSDNVETWNSGRIRYLLAHSKSAGHGLNLQGGGCRILYYTPIWSNDTFKQANARLWRRGQKYPVVVTNLIAKGTINELTVERVADKDAYDVLLREHCNENDTGSVLR